ncbi:hypothetical protein SporoP37_04145 [Sporosarcina sp. P37]|nr:hypothetical protein SporoP33_03450 [Sporosarcina sp. P33]ARK23971.1 hypothetical protein SporoP37_04145 [Sporosarcina sp. P37]PID16290.1 hypothetical protein CSV62_15700 [Sporosarcina sp. P35]
MCMGAGRGRLVVEVGEFNAVLALVSGSSLDRLLGIEGSECPLLGPAQARGGLPYVMSQLAKSAPVVS